jgi:hypothetical protein
MNDVDDDEVLLMAASKFLNFPPKQKKGNKQMM